MTTAFQSNAFQSDAFQIDDARAIEGIPSGRRREELLRPKRERQPLIDWGKIERERREELARVVKRVVAQPEITEPVVEAAIVPVVAISSVKDYTVELLMLYHHV